MRVRFGKSFRLPHRQKYGCSASSGRLEDRHSVAIVPVTYSPLFTRFACAMDSCGTVSCVFYEAHWQRADIRFRLRKNSLFAAKVIMVDILGSKARALSSRWATDRVYEASRRLAVFITRGQMKNWRLGA